MKSLKHSTGDDGEPGGVKNAAGGMLGVRLLELVMDEEVEVVDVVVVVELEMDKEVVETAGTNVVDVFETGVVLFREVEMVLFHAGAVSFEKPPDEVLLRALRDTHLYGDVVSPLCCSNA